MIALWWMLLMWCSAVTGYVGYMTTYGSSWEGNACGIKNVSNEANVYFLAINRILWEERSPATLCGKCIEITSPRRQVALILNLCPECGREDIDVSTEVYTQVTRQPPGKIVVEWDFVPCPAPWASETVTFAVMPGSNPYWVGLIPQPSHVQIERMQVNIQGTTYPMSYDATGTRAYLYYGNPPMDQQSRFLATTEHGEMEWTWEEIMTAAPFPVVSVSTNPCV